MNAALSLITGTGTLLFGLWMAPLIGCACCVLAAAHLIVEEFA